MQEYVMKKFRIHVPGYACWRAKKLMKVKDEGKHEEGYKGLRS